MATPMKPAARCVCGSVVCYGLTPRRGIKSSLLQIGGTWWGTKEVTCSAAAYQHQGQTGKHSS